MTFINKNDFLNKNSIVIFKEEVFMKISIFGVGYVGLVTGVCFSEMGSEVLCCDVDTNKIEKLKDGISPIYEPGLDELIQSNLQAKRLQFTTEVKPTVETADIIFIAVGTPSDVDGSSDLKYVLKVAETIGAYINKPKIVIVKSTVPVGTCQKVKKTIQNQMNLRGVSYDLQIVSNPEFLKEGTAINDCLRPSRVIVGIESDSVRSKIAELYAPFFPKDNQTIFFMDIASSELTKYAANAMLATRISFMNEIALLCERVDANVESIRLGIGSDPRIGSQFLYAGIGYGGSCFPKDIRALLNTGMQNDLPMDLLKSVELINKHQKSHFISKISKFYGNDLKNKKFALWGLSFKPGTDDIREAPSLDVINFLTGAGAKVTAYDPEAIDNTRAFLGTNTNVCFVNDQYEALNDADALVVVTEWKSFRLPDFGKMKSLMANKVIFDGRNIYESKTIATYGFKYFPIGKKVVS